MNWHITDNNSKSIPLGAIPEVEYADLYQEASRLLADADYHIAHYFAVPQKDNSLRFFFIMLDDAAHRVMTCSFVSDYWNAELPSLTAVYAGAHCFEREIAERYGIRFTGQPWDKPLRFASDSIFRGRSIDDYPFYRMEGEALHEVNVGPIHAGIIEPGAFRFICNGEKVLHLEVALGYQHRGVEQTFTATDNRLRQCLIAESAAGDSSVAGATAASMVMERLSEGSAEHGYETTRTIALELERIATHIADTGALCTDIGYQLGQVACEALRTVTINTTQMWCGNRFGKGIVRPMGSYYPLTEEIKGKIRANITDVRRRYEEVARDIKSLPSLLARFESCGTVAAEQMRSIGGVGTAARASGLARDIRASHPWGTYSTTIRHTPVTKQYGDIMSRLTVRKNEVLQSADYVLSLLDEAPSKLPEPDYRTPLAADSLSFALVEGWRGEICHVAVTDSRGRIACYKIKDPSMHNWLALALAVRSEGISDFPICNKSFNLSYCGHDL